MGAGIKEKIKDKSKENYYVEEEALWEKIVKERRNKNDNSKY